MADESTSANRSARRRGSLPYMQETMNLTATWISGIGAIIFVSLFCIVSLMMNYQSLNGEVRLNPGCFFSSLFKKADFN